MLFYVSVSRKQKKYTLIYTKIITIKCLHFTSFFCLCTLQAFTLHHMEEATVSHLAKCH